MGRILRWGSLQLCQSLVLEWTLNVLRHFKFGYTSLYNHELGGNISEQISRFDTCVDYGCHLLPYFKNVGYADFLIFLMLKTGFQEIEQSQSQGC